MYDVVNNTLIQTSSSSDSAEQSADRGIEEYFTICKIVFTGKKYEEFSTLFDPSANWGEVRSVEAVDSGEEKEDSCEADL